MKNFNTLPSFFINTLKIFKLLFNIFQIHDQCFFQVLVQYFFQILSSTYFQILVMHFSNTYLTFSYIHDQHLFKYLFHIF